MSGLVTTANARNVNAIVSPSGNFLTSREAAKLAGNRDPLTGKPIMEVVRFMKINQPFSGRAKEGLAFFKKSFPDPNEREALYLIRDRIKEVNDPATKQAKYDSHNFHSVVAFHAETGELLGYCQWSYLAQEGSNAVYSQYMAVEEAYRQLGIATLMTDMRFTVSSEDARLAGLDMRLGGAVSESEFKGQGSDAESILFTYDRLVAHQRQGKSAFTLVMPDGSSVPLWIQPCISEQAYPYMLNLLYRQADPTLIDVSKPVEVDKERARAIVGGLMFNFITEGFHLMEHNNGKLAPYLAMLNGNAPANPKDSVALVKALMLDFIDRARAVVLVPAAATQTITQYAANHPILGMQVARDYGSIMQHEQTIARTVAKQ